MTKRKSRKGGQPVKNMPRSIRFKRNVHNKDCGASVVKFLGYATEEDSDLAEKTPNGIRSPIMLKLLWKAYGNIGFRWQIIDIKKPEDLQELKSNESTIGFYFSSERSGHYFVVHRRAGSAWAIDPQTNEIFPLSKYLNTPFKRATFHICLIDNDKESIDYGDSKITKQIIDEVLEEQDHLAAEASAEQASESRQAAEQAED
jgi:hypothetical protein